MKTQAELEAMEDRELELLLGFAQGWVTYPSDSVEEGKVFYLDKETAPFGSFREVRSFKPCSNPNDIMSLVREHKISSWHDGNINCWFANQTFISGGYLCDKFDEDIADICLYRAATIVLILILQEKE